MPQTREDSSLQNIDWAVAKDDCCAGVAIKRGYRYPQLYFRDDI